MHLAYLLLVQMSVFAHNQLVPIREYLKGYKLHSFFRWPDDQGRADAVPVNTDALSPARISPYQRDHPGKVQSLDFTLLYVPRSFPHVLIFME